MIPFDHSDPERWQPSVQTPRCALCDEAAMPRYGGYCFRHMGAHVPARRARTAIAARYL